MQKIKPYIQIARPDHWFKNIFMLFGTLLAFFIHPTFSLSSDLPLLISAFFLVSLVASSNYVINEVLDAEKDKHHPKKQSRPVPSGKVKVPIALAEWLILAVISISLSFKINAPFGFSALFLWLMGIVYNVPPFRTKEVPYLDVLSESINNPIRLLLGWFILIPDHFPPLSLFIAYWMFGAFFMAIKRFAEYRKIADSEAAAKYRASFKHYNQDRLLISFFFYVVTGAFFSGVFIVRYHLELIFYLPFAAGFLTYYLKLGLHGDSPVQAPEKLYREKGFMVYTLSSLIIFILLMFIQVPPLYKIFNITPKKETIIPLWKIEKPLSLFSRKALIPLDNGQSQVPENE